MGFFLGDNKGHKPARVSWDGTNVAVEAYEELDYGAATKVYLRGASVMPRMPEGTTALKADAPRDAYLELTSWKYPLVKIFNNVWTRENWHSGNSEFFPVGNYEVNVNGEKLTIKDQPLRSDREYLADFPSGWRVPSKDDAQSLLDKLINNGFAQPITALIYGGVTGFEEVASYLPTNEYAWVYYWLDKGDYTLAFRLPLGAAEVHKSPGPIFVVRLVKKL